MNALRLHDLRRYASTFRSAIEHARNEGAFTNDAFQRFPAGCCGDASILLAQYLLEKKIHTVYVCGLYYYDSPEIQTQSHAWLQCRNGIIIDITGDQFNNRPEFNYYNIPVFVGKIDNMHLHFEVNTQNTHDADYKKMRFFDLGRIQSLYSIIKGRISE